MLVEQVRNFFDFLCIFTFKNHSNLLTPQLLHFQRISLNIQFPDVFKFLYKINSLIWSRSSFINHAHNGQRKLVKTLTPHLNCSSCIGLKVWSINKDLLYCFPLWEASIVSDLPLFFFPVTTAVCHLFSTPKEVIVLSRPLLWVTGTVRAVCQFSLDFPSPPHQTKISLSKEVPWDSGKPEASSSPKVSEELWL